MVNIRKRGKVYQYQFEIAKVEGKRKYISKSGFKTKNEAQYLTDNNCFLFSYDLKKYFHQL